MIPATSLQLLGLFKQLQCSFVSSTRRVKAQPVNSSHNEVE